MSYLNWHVGMKVVCVDNRGQEHSLTVGAVYTIAAIGPGISSSGVFIAVVEKPMNATTGVDWYIERFRPVEKRKTDISIFTAMLKDADKKVPA